MKYLGALSLVKSKLSLFQLSRHLQIYDYVLLGWITRAKLYVLRRRFASSEHVPAGT